MDLKSKFILGNIGTGDWSNPLPIEIFCYKVDYQNLIGSKLTG